MRKYVLLGLLVAMAAGLPTTVSGQKMGVKVDPNDPFAYRIAAFTYGTFPLQAEPTVETVKAYLKEHNPNLLDKSSDLQLQYQKTSPGGLHFSFLQTYGGVVVYNSEVKVNTDKHQNIRSIIDNTYPTGDWANRYLPQAANGFPVQAVVEKHLATHADYGQVVKQAVVIAVIKGQPAVYLELETQNLDKGTYYRYLLDEDGNEAYSHDLNRYYGPTSNALGTGRPYLPDPLTRAGVYYGAPYVNADDSDLAVLNNQRVLIDTLHVTLDSSSGTYTLANSRIQITDFSAPNIAAATSSTPVFSFTRSQTGFEDVNAFYHLSVHNNYVSSLGYDDLADFLIKVDTHALNGDDNSMFSGEVGPGGGQPRLLFGDGGVNDAEDADVIVHEYSHAMSSSGSPGGNSGMQRDAIDEGLADYFATSYSRSLYEFRWADMFTWDGHNEFWDGRTAISNLVYPDNANDEIHLAGQMWNTDLMKMWGQLGRATTDRLMLETLYGLGSGLNFQQAAVVFQQADSVLNGGVNACIIFNSFYNNGIFDSTFAPSGCKVTGIEQVAQIDKDIRLVNTDGFAFRGEDAMVENNGFAHMERMTLTDVTGRNIWTKEKPADVEYIQSRNLPCGIYIITIDTGAGTISRKLAKVE